MTSRRDPKDIFFLPTHCVASETMEHPRVNKQVAGGRLGPCPRFLPETSHRSQQRRRAAARRKPQEERRSRSGSNHRHRQSLPDPKQGGPRFSRSNQRKCEMTCMCTISSMLSKPTTKEPRFLITKRETISSRCSQGSKGML